MNRYAALALAITACLLATACQDQQAGQQAPVAGHGHTATSPSDPAEKQDAAVPLVDVIETSASRIIGISYPHDAGIPAGLARILMAYADQARAELQAALDGLGNDKPRVPYELSLSFTVNAQTPSLIAVSADGSRYTGGAHGQPLMARFVWLKQQGRLLPVQELISSEASRTAVAAYVQAQLTGEMESRLRADNLAEADYQQLREQAKQMIDEGTVAEAENFSHYRPVLDRDGNVTALRFVFPPYQVGPYSDGTQSVDVPMQWLRPHLAAEYLALFDPPAEPVAQR